MIMRKKKRRNIGKKIFVKEDSRPFPSVNRVYTFRINSLNSKLKSEKSNIKYEDAKLLPKLLPLNYSHQTSIYIHKFSKENNNTNKCRADS